MGLIPSDGFETVGGINRMVVEIEKGGSFMGDGYTGNMEDRLDAQVTCHKPLSVREYKDFLHESGNPKVTGVVVGICITQLLEYKDCRLDAQVTGVVVGICITQLIHNITGNPEVRVTKENRAVGILDNFDEGHKYRENLVRKFVRGRAPEIMPSINDFFSKPDL